MSCISVKIFLFCSDSILPEYSFKVDLPKTESGPPLRTFNQPGKIIMVPAALCKLLMKLHS